MTDSVPPKLDPREQHFFIESPRDGLKLFLRFLGPIAEAPEVRPVVYVHGATFPSGLSIAHRFDGRSWRDELCEAGFAAWGFDFLGFGLSDRYPEMNEGAESQPPLLRAADAADQLTEVLRFVSARHGHARVSLICHSWGSFPGCIVASRHPRLIDRVVLFGPIARRTPGDHEPPSAPGWRLLSIKDQWDRFIEDVPAGAEAVLSEQHFHEWAHSYLDSDPPSRTRDPPSVKIPTGPFVDILTAWHGELPYDPAALNAPVALIRGEWDSLLPDEDARWLFDAFSSSPEKRDVKISRATHLMHLERMRHALHRESIAFLHP
ncbi:MAG: alpha/beta fold hydrolase [Methylobacteriaceae bacterium]|nr:alpha/beta fold hydrolase [Methylobacteriaceae bacterium]